MECVRRMRAWTGACTLLLLYCAMGNLSWAEDAPKKAEPAATAAAAEEPKKEEAPKAITQADIDAAKGEIAVKLDSIWTIITAFLVFFMNLGFAMVESGLCRAKNCVNILAKNFVVFACASLAFYVLGWGLMFGHGPEGFVGKEGIWLSGGADNSPVTTTLASLIKTDIKDAHGIDLADEKTKAAYKSLDDAITAENDKALLAVTKPDVEYKVSLDVKDKGKFEKSYPSSSFYWGTYNSIRWAGVPFWVKFFFQLVFCGTAATIVSGAVAERIKFGSFVLFSFLLCGIVYPIVGHMVWGGGLLGAGGMFDFAGSTVVHSVGGWAALAGVILLGPRLGKYGKDGQVNPIPGHSMTSVTLGGLVLWFGWFGFNPGSTMAADAAAIGHIAMTTNMSAAVATLTAAITAWLMLGKPDLSMIVNGTLAGLVAITAPCAFVSVGSSLIIGAAAGVIVVFAVLMFDKLKLDDPVGALSVHLVNGIFGTLCVGLFASPEVGAWSAGAGVKKGLFMGGGMDQLMPQLKGVAVAGAVTFALSMLFWAILKFTVGIRVSADEENEGLDIGEHGGRAYPDFEAVPGGTPHQPSGGAVPVGASGQ